MVSSPEDPAVPPGPSTTGPVPSRFRRLRPLALGLVGALVGVAAYVVVVDPSDDPAPPAATAPPTTTTVATARAAEVYDVILPSLVLVSTDAADGERSGIGSGVVVNDEGLVLTAHHVVDGAQTIALTFSDGTSATASVADADPANDIAILVPDRLPDVVVPAVLGGGVRVGDDVYPVGNPLGFSGSLTAGVVSGLDRSIERDDGGGSLDGLIQFDAAVNPGSSGGPLVNRDGQVVGIVTALANFTQQRTFIGLGFAVPISTASGGAAEIPR